MNRTLIADSMNLHKGRKHGVERFQIDTVRLSCVPVRQEGWVCETTTHRTSVCGAANLSSDILLHNILPEKVLVI